jgi:adenylate cyclase
LIYRQGDIDLDRASRELRIAYALVIGVQRDGGRVRVSARLIDTATRAHLWAERFDSGTKDIFAVQDEIAEQISCLLVSHLNHAEREKAKRKLPENMVAYDYYLRAMDQSRIWHKTGFAEAERMLERCLALEPDFAPALVAQSWLLISSWIEPKGREGWLGWDDRRALEQGIQAARTAVQRDPHLPSAHAVLGWGLFWFGARDEGIASYRRAHALNPGFVDGRLGFLLAIAGRPAEGMRILLRARSLDPFHPPFLLGWIGACHLLLGEPDAALHTLRDCVTRAPAWRLGHLWLAATCCRLGLHDEARRAAAAVLAIDPTFTVSGWSRLHGFRDIARVEAIRADLVRSGVPAGIDDAN